MTDSTMRGHSWSMYGLQRLLILFAMFLCAAFAYAGCSSPDIAVVRDDGGPPSCVPGQSIECAGSYGCVSHQVCNADGKSYGACDCPEGGVGNYDGSVPDGYAPLPPSLGDQGYIAIWSSSAHLLFLPLFSAPECGLDYPYGEYYAVEFQPNTAGPVGSFSACGVSLPGAPPPCYSPERWIGDPGGGSNFEDIAGGTYSLSAFDGNGIATGKMSTSEGVVTLVVKNCD